MKPQWNRVASMFALASTALLTSQSLFGAGFILHEQSVSGLGVGFANGAAGFEGDNSSMFFNPATLSLVPGTQVTGAVHVIMPEAKFNNNGTLSLYNPSDTSSGIPTQGPDATSKETAIIPNIYASTQLTDQLFIGLGISTPYGLATSYDDGWVGRYVALETDLKTINSNLAVAYKFSDQFTLAVGASVCYADALLSNALDLGARYLSSVNAGVFPADPTLVGAVQGSLGTSTYDGLAELTGDDIGFGYNVGMLFQPNETVRIGVHYRSKIALEIDGNARFMVPQALSPYFGSVFANQGGSVNLDLPDTAQISFHKAITPKWAVMADVFRTFWSEFDALDIRFSDGILPNNYIPEKWEDTWRFSVGTTIQTTDTIELRFGLVYDESPVTSEVYRSPRIPDEDRFWVAIGLGWKLSESLRLDIAYVNISVDDPYIYNDTHTTGTFLKGTMNASVDILSVGGSFSF